MEDKESIFRFVNFQGSTNLNQHLDNVDTNSFDMEFDLAAAAE